MQITIEEINTLSETMKKASRENGIMETHKKIKSEEIEAIIKELKDDYENNSLYHVFRSFNNYIKASSKAKKIIKEKLKEN